MKTKIVSVSIGIPAFNEESNIRKLIEALLLQKQKNFLLKQIIVVSDKSTDQTVSEVLSISDNRLLLIKNKKRIGQALSQNIIIKENKSDILVLLNADVLPNNNLFINELIKPFLKNNRVGLVGAKVLPVGSDTIFGSIIDSSTELKRHLYQYKNNGNNIYHCHGRGRAFSKEFLKVFSWNKTVAEDAYSYLYCIKSGFEFIYQPKAIVFYKSPQTIKDHLHQSVRFIQSRKQMEHLFGSEFVTDQYEFPHKYLFWEILKFGFKNPLMLFVYCLVYVYAQLKAKFSAMVDVAWEVSLSSKVVAR